MITLARELLDWSVDFTLLVGIVTTAVFVGIATPVLFLVGPNHSRH